MIEILCTLHFATMHSLQEGRPTLANIYEFQEADRLKISNTLLLGVMRLPCSGIKGGG